MDLAFCLLYAFFEGLTLALGIDTFRLTRLIILTLFIGASSDT